MNRKISTTFIFLTVVVPLYAVSIKDGTFAGADHFVIKTKKATYYYDKEGGGLSRMIDKFGNDWISFKKDPWDQFPASAASSFRGLPNFVQGSDDDGAGHPGYKKCYSFKVSDNSILTISKSGTWQWRWTFYEQYASVTIEKTDANHKYWFLYAGPIAGEFAPGQYYWGTNLGGPRREISNINKGDRIFANWHWVYFGDMRVKQALFIIMAQPDRSIDSLGFLGSSDQDGMNSDEGMVLFGFGRHSDSEPQLSAKNNTFIIGFYDGKIKNESQHNSIQKTILGLLK